ncbi:hypothetical protein BgiBS90_022754 [Biomphalaria glabrata]|nr:hypothetical protein BgiBS90_022754 [Biomphalaria glabrata]
MTATVRLTTGLRDTATAVSRDNHSARHTGDANPRHTFPEMKISATFIFTKSQEAKPASHLMAEDSCLRAGFIMSTQQAPLTNPLVTTSGGNELSPADTKTQVARVIVDHGAQTREISRSLTQRLVSVVCDNSIQ